MSVSEVGSMSLWQFLAAVEGWRAAHAPPEGPKALTDDEHDALVAKYG